MIFDAFTRPDGIAVAYGDTEIEGIPVADARKLAARIIMACDRADAADRAREQAERRRAAADVFRRNCPEAFESPSATLGPLLVADVHGERPYVHVVNTGHTTWVDYSEVLTAPPTWLVDSGRQKAHLWRGGSTVVCGEYKGRSRLTIVYHDKAPRCPACVAKEGE